MKPSHAGFALLVVIVARRIVKYHSVRFAGVIILSFVNSALLLSIGCCNLVLIGKVGIYIQCKFEPKRTLAENTEFSLNVSFI